MNHAYLRYPTVTELSDFLNTEYVCSLFLTSSIWNVVCNFDCKTFRSFVWSRKWTVNERFEARLKKRKTDFEKNHSFAVLTNLTFLMFKLTIFPSSFPSAGSARLSFFFFFLLFYWLSPLSFLSERHENNPRERMTSMTRNCNETRFSINLACNSSCFLRLSLAHFIDCGLRRED